MADFLDQPNVENDRKQGDLRQSFRAVLANPDGRAVLFWMLGQAGIYTDAFTGDEAGTNYRLGQQAIGRRLLSMMDEIDPRAYPKLLLQVAEDEAMAREAETKAEKEDDNEAV